MHSAIRVSLGLAALALCAAATAQDQAKPAAAPAGDMAALVIKLPEPIINGTPKNIPPSPKIEPKTTKPRPPFMAPKGAVNLAEKKPVTSSVKTPIIGDLAQITDGDKEGPDGSFVELNPGKQWVQVDLGQASDIYAVVVWHYHAEDRVYNDVVVQISDNADFVEGVATIYNNDDDNSSGLGIGTDKQYIDKTEGRLIDAKGAKGRYVRLYSSGNTSNQLNHYIEVDVYGKPAEKK